MTTNIILSQREKDHLQTAAEILREYSRIFSASVYGKTGMHIDNAGTAAGMLEAIIKEQEKTKAETAA